MGHGTTQFCLSDTKTREVMETITDCFWIMCIITVLKTPGLSPPTTTLDSTLTADKSCPQPCHWVLHLPRSRQSTYLHPELCHQRQALRCLVLRLYCNVNTTSNNRCLAPPLDRELRLGLIWPGLHLLRVKSLAIVACIASVRGTVWCATVRNRLVDDNQQLGEDRQPSRESAYHHPD